ncbi:hypothetical protein DPEC_G00318870 [Dallia pectoralis]|uniref:Uncharacterized protein n=1 Tax=Dallia pectoralis TaxID=75939 RepID=A0ACC2F9I9_DALPE|nr:hypothetical protein DPEC_G00318870 [Dallia pectoralis]
MIPTGQSLTGRRFYPQHKQQAAGRAGWTSCRDNRSASRLTVNLSKMNSNYPACGPGGWSASGTPETPPLTPHNNTALDNHQPKHPLIDSNWASLLLLRSDRPTEALWSR